MLDNTTPAAKYFNAALMAFIFGLPLSFGNLLTLAYFHGFMLLFTLAVLIWGRKQNVGVWHSFTEHKIAYWLLAAWGVAAIASFIKVLLFSHTSTLHILASTQRIINDFYILGFIFALAILHHKRAFSLPHAIIALSLGMVLMMLVHISIYLQTLPDGNVWFRNPPLAPHIRDLGNMACVCIVGLSVLLLRKNSQIKHSMFYGLLLLINAGFLVWCGGRMGIIAATITCLVLLAAYRIYQQVSVAKITVWFACIILGTALSQPFSVFEWNGFARTTELSEQVQSTNTQADSQATLEQLNQLSTGRAQMWLMSLKAFAKEPILGLGPYGYFFIPERTYDDQPHNFVVQFLVEWGLLGTVPLLALLLLCAYQEIKVIPQAMHNDNSHFIIGCTIVLVLTLHGLTGGTYFKIQPFFCLALGFSVFLRGSKITQTS